MIAVTADTGNQNKTELVQHTRNHHFESQIACMQSLSYMIIAYISYV